MTKKYRPTDLSTTGNTQPVDIIKTAEKIRNQLVETKRLGDQIGRIFAHWAIVFFGQFFNSTSMYVAQICGLLFPR
jgi:hypothetical protein